MMRDACAREHQAEELPEEEQIRLAQILDDYVAAAERGEPLTPAELLARHPADAETLRPYLSGLNLFHAAAVGGARRMTVSAVPLEPRRSSVQRIDDFEIIREIGRGGMGVVYEAEQLSLRRRVALKVLPLAAASDAKHLGRFKNEAQAAAGVQHPNIVPVFAVGEASGVHYFAMQLIEGQSLASVLHGEGQLTARSPGMATTLQNATATWPAAGAPPRESLVPRQSTAIDATAVARWGQQAAEALHAAHEYGVVHRDVKPSNLLVDRQGKLWVADFGLARRREGADLTRTGDVCGTMRYMSPEQAFGNATLVDHRSDVYSLGVTLYELAAGRHPMDDVGDLRQYFNRGVAACKPLRHWNRRIAIDFETIVMKAMAESRSDRYSTAQEMADDLGRFLAGRPILATPPTRFTKIRKWAGRHKRGVVAAACLLAVGTAWFVASASYIAGARAQRDIAATEARDSSQWFGELLYDVPLRTAEQLAGIPGTDGVRRQLLEESLAYYVKLSEQAYGDPALGAELALAYSKIAGLASVMGDRDKALAAHRDARRILEDLVAEHPDNDEYARNLALCCNNAGRLLGDMGRVDEAFAELTAARERQESLRERRPSWNELATDLAATYSNLGATAAQRGDRADAAQWVQAAIDLLEPLLIARPDDQALLRSMAASYSLQGSLVQTQDPAGAIGAHWRTVDMFRRLVANSPLNQTYQAELARSYNNVGYASALARRWPAAQQAYRDAIQLQSNLVTQSPLSLPHRRDLAATHNNLGMALCNSGQLDDAERAFRQAIEAQQPLLEWRPDDAVILSDAGAIHNNLGMLLDRREQPADAASEFRSAVTLQRRALDAQPENAAARDLLANHFANYAKHLQQHGQLIEARDMARQRVALWSGASERRSAAIRELAALERRLGASPATDDMN